MESNPHQTDRPPRYPDDVASWSVALEQLALDVNRRTAEAITAHLTASNAERAEHGTRSSDLREAAERRLVEAKDSHERELADIARSREDTQTEAEQTLGNNRERILREAIDRQNAAKAAIEEATWLAETVFEANEDRPRLEYEEARAEFASLKEEFEQIERRMTRESRRYLQKRPRRPEPPPELSADAMTTLRLELATAREVADRFRRIRIAMMYRGPIFVPPLALMVGGGAGVGWWLGTTDQAVQIGAAVGFGLFLVTYLVGYVFATRAVRSGWRAFHRCQGLVITALAASEADAMTKREANEATLRTTRDRELEQAENRFKPIIGEAKKTALLRIKDLEEAAPARIQEIDREHDARLEAARRTHETSMAGIREACDDAIDGEKQRHAEAIIEIDRALEGDLTTQRTQWTEAAGPLTGDLTRSMEIMRSLFPDVGDASETRWSESSSSPPGIPFGRLQFQRTPIEPAVLDALSVEDQAPRAFTLPAALGLPSRASLSLIVDEASRERGLDTIRSIVLRLLLGIPPGKAQFTLLDPVGLGENFAGFMHLEDERPGLVGERIWTERGQIEQRLVNLTETMETVIQKYLRNEFESIEAYNEVAGEIAEPYRFLVVSDFPQGFSEESVRRLTSILRSGPRCGVFTLLLRDTGTALPEGFDPAVLRETTLGLHLDGGRSVFDVDGLSELPLELDRPPKDGLLIDLVKQVGRAAAAAGRVEVPFQTIAPTDPEDYWSRSSAEEIRIPLGRSGASRLQELVLGRGTAQHALIAGKTGSGKSTLLHALVTNLACWYSPDELEFYLVDFKKGVEFKTYAVHNLPHARAVAVESDREFGLSVLKGLDEELSRRGELFRDAEVQDVPGWRNRRPDSPMPRVLLVIDEFQELFVTDDQLAQEAGLLLDRLVRQGRAFGMHVVLGSQTLGGAYSLNRTTMGQMGVRIALACNEQDSMLILSDDNVAARLLSRPGEAIYNDQGGLIEGNSPFQVCWLPDEVREGYLERVESLVTERPIAETSPPLVFEGSAPAHLSQNESLRNRIESRPAAVPAEVPILLGEAVAIAPATAAILRRQAGANLVTVGQQADPAMAASVAALLSVAAAHRAEDLRIVLLDGTPADDPNAGLLERIGDRLPHECRVVAFRETADAIGELGVELSRRIEEDGPVDGNRVLLVHGLQRFRVLRRAEDDFSFSDSDAPPTPDKIFAELVREGPEQGMWVVISVDTVQSLERVVDRFSMRSFDQRSLFQQSATDSSTLIDSTSASDLGPNRAVLYSDERGTLEKYRPWSIPSEAFLLDATSKIAAREG